MRDIPWGVVSSRARDGVEAVKAVERALMEAEGRGLRVKRVLVSERVALALLSLGEEMLRASRRPVQEREREFARVQGRMRAGLSFSRVRGVPVHCNPFSDVDIEVVT
ncbi:MAG: hypothetical protein ACUVS5_12095 [Anaerolineae bacterium]